MIESTEQALLNAIRANPDDEAPRLIYADWLDEHDQSERAAFTRKPIRLLWERYAYGKWRWYHERQGSDGTKYWYPNAMDHPRPAWYPAIFPQTWRRHLSHVVFRQGFVEELMVERFHSNVKKLLRDQPVTTITTTATALLGYILNFDETNCLRSIKLTAIPEQCTAIRHGDAVHFYFPGVEGPVSIPLMPPSIHTFGPVDTPAEVCYRLGRVFGHYLTPHGIAVQLPSTIV